MPPKKSVTRPKTVKSATKVLKPLPSRANAKAQANRTALNTRRASGLNGVANGRTKTR